MIGWKLMRLDYIEKMRLLLQFLDVDIEIDVIKKNYPDPDHKNLDQ